MEAFSQKALSNVCETDKILKRDKAPPTFLKVSEPCMFLVLKPAIYLRIPGSRYWRVL